MKCPIEMRFLELLLIAGYLTIDDCLEAQEEFDYLECND